ncbi:hypothetical protein ACFVT1_07580 [Streptomyces sp. NPDC057963]|uniref:hypothetical protein n=1 Tax=Streptomyces sp. NPDC057963 TaxID=3346290 RepID=UPI0036E16553
MGEAPPQRLADAVHAAWVAFVRDLDPGAAWPAYSTERRETRTWNTDSRTEFDPLRSVRKTWLAAET